MPGGADPGAADGDRMSPTRPTTRATGLTPRQAAFVAEYLVDLNATQAAIRAGYSARTAEVQGPRLLGNVRVAAAIGQATTRRLTRLEVQGDRVVAELARLGFSDIRRVFDAEGRLLPPRAWPDDLAAAIASIEVVTTTVPGSKPVAVEHVAKIKLWDKPKALELLGRHAGIFPDAGARGLGVHVGKDGAVTVLYGFDASAFPKAPGGSE